MRNRKAPTVNPYGNYVFAHLSKLYHCFFNVTASAVCQWDNDKIIVNSNVTIESPYSVDKVSGDEVPAKEVKEWVGRCARGLMNSCRT